MKARHSLLIFSIVIFLFFNPWALAGERQVPKEVENEDSLSIKWYKYDQGLTQAQSEDKRIFLFFRSRWCKWCNIMERTTFLDEGVIHRLNNDFVPVKLDIDSKKRTMELEGKKISDKDVAKMYNVFSFPYIVFLDSNQSNIGVLPGYIETGDFSLILEYIGDGHYQDESFKEFAKRKKEKTKKK